MGNQASSKAPKAADIGDIARWASIRKAND